MQTVSPYIRPKTSSHRSKIVQVFTKKNPYISKPTQFKSILFKSNLYIKKEKNAVDMTVCIESPKESTKKLLLKLVNEISNVVGYEVNIKKKSLIFVNTGDE